MPESDFATEILETEVVVNHDAEGHVFHFPILSNGTVACTAQRSKQIRLPSVRRDGIFLTLTMLPDPHSDAARRDRDLSFLTWER